jgi:hypothetical protein
MIYNFNTAFTQESLQGFLEFLNNSGEDKVDIYLNSNGGSSWCAQVILDIIESDSERFTLTAYGQIGSAAFTLFFKAPCIRKILPTCVGMYHQAKMRVDVNFRSRPFGQDDTAFVKALEEDFESDLAFIKTLKFSEEEIEKYLDGQDIFFQCDRLKQFLNVSDLHQIKSKP